MAQNGNSRGSGTGVFLPPAITNRLQRSTKSAQEDVAASPDVSPANSRSSSFTGGRPPQRHPAPRAVNSETKLQRQQRAVAVRKQASCGAGDALCRTRTPPAQQQTTYGRFSLDESSSSSANAYPAGRSHLQTPPHSAAWPGGSFVCNSLSVPATPSAGGYASDSGMMTPGQQQTSWTSTVSGDTCMLAASGDAAAVLATTQQLHMAQRHEYDLQLLQAQRAQLLQMAQQEQERQELLQLAHDSALLAQLQYAAAPGAASGPSQRRASMGCYNLQATDAQLLVRDAMEGQAYSLPLHPSNTQLPAPVTCPLPSVGVGAGALADAYDSALEAELDAALQQLLALRSEVAQKKALAQQAKARRASMGSAPEPLPLAATIPGVLGAASPEAASGGLPAAAVLSSQLFQPYGAPAAGALSCPGPNSVSVSTAQAPCVHACMPVVSNQVHAAFGGFAPPMAAHIQGCGPGSCFSAAGQGVHTSGAAGPMLGFAGNASSLHASLGQAGDAGGSLADFLGCHAGVGQPTDQQQLQLLALCQAGSAAVGVAGPAATC